MSPRDIAGWSLVGGGITAGAAGGVLVANAAGFKTETLDPSYLAYKDAFYGDDFESLRASYLQNLDSYRLQSVSGTVSAGIGAGCLIAGIILLVLPEPIDGNVGIGGGAAEISMRISY